MGTTLDERTRRSRVHAAWGRIAIVAVVAAAALVLVPASFGRVLRVGSYHGVAGQFQTIQSAVDAAKRGDWILVGPGDYHERADFSRRHHAPADESGAGVLIKKGRLHIRGMNRNRVIVDGTKPGSRACSSKLGAQDFGPKGKNGKRVGRNGIEVFRADGVTIDNLTACNFLGRSNDATQIWWNGGDGSGKLGMSAWYGNYLSATSTFYRANEKQAGYGLFASNSRGPGRFAHSYASNMNDAGVYIGACRRQCNAVVTKSLFEFNAVGYSGTNAGGSLVLKNSEWDRNATGIITNSQNNDDFPSPQDGRCPGGRTSPITHTISCLVFEHNDVHDNNNPNVPKASTARAAPVGTGVSIAGGRFDTVMHNTIADNGAWGILLAPFPDDEKPPKGQHCQGGTSDTILAGFGFTCTFDDWGNQLFDNMFKNDGFFGNPTNGDVGELTLINGKPINCYRGNTTPDGTSPADVQQAQTNCGQTGTANNNLSLLAESACDTQLDTSLCSPSDRYPRATTVVMHPLPTKKLESMPNPCNGVPANPWCPAPRRQHRAP